MRVVVFFLYLCFYLLSGGSSLHAATHSDRICISSSSHFVKNHQIKLTNSDQGTTLIEDVDLDLDEEYHCGDDVSDRTANKFFSENDSLLNRWYLPVSQRFLLNYHYKRYKIFPSFCGYSNPIYITQRVLRL
jgi:hypothetical protein